MNLFLGWFAYLSVFHFSVFLAVHLFVHLSVCLTIYPFICNLPVLVFVGTLLYMLFVEGMRRMKFWLDHPVPAESQ